MALFHVEAPIIQSIQPYHDHSRSTSCNNEFVAERALISTLALDSVPIPYRRIMKLLIDYRLPATVNHCERLRWRYCEGVKNSLVGFLYIY